MPNSRKQNFFNGRSDQQPTTAENDIVNSSPIDKTSIVGSRSISPENGSSSDTGLRERLTEALVNDSDGDLLIQSDGREDRVMQWLQALDMQFIGACRAEERLKPCLKSKDLSNVIEDGLLAYLSQYFEPFEVGMLARCFCIPLVSIRVGKISKQGTFFCPTNTRGSLSLTLLPTSDLRLSLIWDNGHTERLVTLSSKSQCSVLIEDISTDNSARSFLVQVPDGKSYYYWCAEKSKLLGTELILKMKDLISRKPSIAELTGIDESRLSCFATHLRIYLLGSAVSRTRDTFTESTSDSETSPNSHISPKSTRTRHLSNQAVKGNAIYQGSLSPRSSPFKENFLKNFSFKNCTRDKLRRRGENCFMPLDYLTIMSSTTADLISSIHTGIGRKFCGIATTGSHVPSLRLPLFSPYYCWYAQATSSVKLPLLPPLSSVLPTCGSTMPTSQQLLVFSPLMCDPIVHISTSKLLRPPENNSIVEKSARETLRRLLSSTKTNPQISDVEKIAKTGDTLPEDSGNLEKTFTFSKSPDSLN